jgi:hypothetical protein
MMTTAKSRKNAPRYTSPADSRYIPFTQQPYCCAPTSIQIIMHKLGLPLVSQEELGYHLGLVVPPRDKMLFWNARVSERPPSEAGYGTQIQEPEYHPNEAFKKLNIPLDFVYNFIDNFNSVEEMRFYLRDAEKNDLDIIVCYRYGTLHDTDSSDGHANVFDHYLPGTDEVRLIDPAASAPKWRIVPLEKLFKAAKEHGADKSGGFWEIKKVGYE